MKRCFKCGVEKPIGDFYVHRKMADGYLGKCKECTKHDMRVDRQTKPRVRAYDRTRAKQPERVALATAGEYCEAIRQWAAETLDCYIPDPDEQGYGAGI